MGLNNLQRDKNEIKFYRRKNLREDYYIMNCIRPSQVTSWIFSWEGWVAFFSILLLSVSV